jgi:hypothetical protein
MIDDRRHAVIRIDGEKIGRELIAAANVHSTTRYARPVSSNNMVTFLPFGVGQKYRSIM